MLTYTVSLAHPDRNPTIFCRCVNAKCRASKSALATFLFHIRQAAFCPSASTHCVATSCAITRSRFSTQSFSLDTTSVSIFCIICNSSKTPCRIDVHASIIHAMLDPGVGEASLFRSRARAVNLRDSVAFSAFHASPRPSIVPNAVLALPWSCRADRTSWTQRSQCSNSLTRRCSRPPDSTNDGSS